MKINSTGNTLHFGNRMIEYQVYRKDRKRLRIIVTPKKNVEVWAPLDAEDEQIDSAVKRKVSWIAQALDKVDVYHPLPAPTRYMSGETIVYLGRQYRLKVKTGNKRQARLVGKFLNVQLKDPSDTKTVKKLVDTWYRKRAYDIFTRYLTKCHTVGSRHGIPESAMVIRSMRKRWGSCSAAGRITLNLKLVHAPVHCVEYVIMHELCHLVHHNHSKAFFSLLTRCLPDWRKRKEALAQICLAEDG